MRLLEPIARLPNLPRGCIRLQPIRPRHPGSNDPHLPVGKHERKHEFRVRQQLGLCVALQQQNG